MFSSYVLSSFIVLPLIAADYTTTLEWLQSISYWYIYFRYRDLPKVNIYYLMESRIII